MDFDLKMQEGRSKQNQVRLEPFWAFVQIVLLPAMDEIVFSNVKRFFNKLQLQFKVRRLGRSLLLYLIIIKMFRIKLLHKQEIFKYWANIMKKGSILPSFEWQRRAPWLTHLHKRPRKSLKKEPQIS